MIEDAPASEKTNPESEKRFVGSRINMVGLFTAAAQALNACAGGDKPSPPPATSASPSSAPPTERVVGPLTSDALAGADLTTSKTGAYRIQ